MRAIFRRTKKDEGGKALLRTIKDRYYIVSVAGETDPNKEAMIGKCTTAKKWKKLFISDLLEKEMPVDAMLLGILETGEGVIDFITEYYNIRFEKED